MTLDGHARAVNFVDFSPDSTRLASASKDKSVKLWDTTTGACIATLWGHEDPVLFVKFSPNMAYFASSSHDTIKIWDPITYDCITTIAGQASSIESIQFSPDSGRLASISPLAVSFWGVPNGTLLGTQEYEGTHAGLSPDFTCLAHFSKDEKILLTNISTGDSKKIFDYRSDDLKFLMFSPDSKQLSFGGPFFYNSKVEIWDTSNDSHISVSIDQGFQAVNFSPDSAKIAVTSRAKGLLLYDVKTGTCVTAFDISSSFTYQLAFSPDSTRLATVWLGIYVQLWDISQFDANSVYKGQTEELGANEIWRSSVLSNSSDRLMYYSFDTLSLWDAATSDCISTLVNQPRIQSALFSPDSSYIAISYIDGTINLWDSTITTLLDTFHCHGSVMGFSANSTSLAFAAAQNSINVWDIPKSSYSMTLGLPESFNIESLALSQDSAYLASLSSRETGYVHIWSTAERECITEIAINAGKQPQMIKFSPDSRLVAAAFGDGAIRLCDVATGTITLTLNGHMENKSIIYLTFSPDLNFLASAGTDQGIKLWDLATGKCVSSIECYTGRPYIDFDSTKPILRTHYGPFTIDDLLSAPENLHAQSEFQVGPRGFGLSKTAEWITWNSKKIVRIPQIYLPRISAVSSSFLYIATDSGRVIFLKLQDPRSSSVAGPASP